MPEWLGKDAFVALVRELGPEIPESRIYLRDAVTVRPFWRPLSLRFTYCMSRLFLSSTTETPRPRPVRQLRQGDHHRMGPAGVPPARHQYPYRNPWPDCDSLTFLRSGVLDCDADQIPFD
eukprot:COSAG01_NODE_1186_length_11341_cov_3.330635_9_plen_120_part_00